jgi:hypothetical protein
LEGRLLLCPALHGGQHARDADTGGGSTLKSTQVSAAGKPGGGGGGGTSLFGFGWASSIGSTGGGGGADVVADAAGNVYLAAGFSGAVDLDPGAGVSALSSAGGSDIFIAKYSPDRALLWARRMGGAQNDGAPGIALDGAGHVYVTGSFEGSATFGELEANQITLSSAGGSDVLVAKVDASSGELAWAGQIGGAGNQRGDGVAADATGAYLTGSFGGIADFDPGAGAFPLTSAGRSDAFVAKLDSAGNFAWARQRGGTTGDSDFGSDIAVDTSGATPTVVVSGTSIRPDNVWSAFAWKVQAGDGGDVWFNNLKGTATFSDSNGSGIAVDAWGNVLLTGSYTATVDFDPGPGTSTLASRSCRDKPGGAVFCMNGYSADVFVLKLDAGGSFIWARSMGGGARGADEGGGIATDVSGAVYTTGNFFDTADFDPGSGTYSLSAKGIANPDWPSTERGVQDTFISKLSAAGNFVWAARVGGDDANSVVDTGEAITVDGAGNVYTTGTFNGAGDFDPTGGTWRLSSAGAVDLFLLKLTQSATMASAASLFDSVASSDATKTDETDLLGKHSERASVYVR